MANRLDAADAAAIKEVLQLLTDVSLEPEEKDRRLREKAGDDYQDQAAEWARKVVGPEQGDKGIRQAYQVALLSRRLYQLSRLAIQERLGSKVPHQMPATMVPLVDKVLLDVVAAKAEEPFDLRPLPNAVVSVLHTFAQQRLMESMARVTAHNRQRLLARQQERLAHDVLLPEPLDPEDEPSTQWLKRGCGVVFAGERELVEAALARYGSYPGSDDPDEEDNPDDPVVLLLGTNRFDQDPVLKGAVSLLPNRWSGCADKASGTSAVIDKAMGELDVDLLVVQNLAVGCSEDRFPTEASRIEEALRRIKGWAQGRKAAILAGVQLEDDELIQDSRFWERLGAHAQVIFLSKEGGEVVFNWHKAPFVFGEPTRRQDERDSGTGEQQCQNDGSLSGGVGDRVELPGPDERED